PLDSWPRRRPDRLQDRILAGAPGCERPQSGNPRVPGRTRGASKLAGSSRPGGVEAMAGNPDRVAAYPTSAHWGSFEVLVRDGRVVGVRPDPADPAPSPLIENMPDAQHHPTRVDRPVARRRWLERGPGPDPRRGAPDDEYVA